MPFASEPSRLKRRGDEVARSNNGAGYVNPYSKQTLEGTSRSKKNEIVMSDRRKNPSQNTGRRSGDRRTAERTASPGAVRFLKAGDAIPAALEGELADISMCGVRLTLAEIPNDLHKLLIEVQHPDEGCFSLMAEVQWIEQCPEGGCNVGCELTVDLSIRHYSALKHLMESLLTAV